MVESDEAKIERRAARERLKIKGVKNSMGNYIVLTEENWDKVWFRACN